ncbi:hypothetical protein [Alistipes provencensis]|uniref:hypothetical protein n=1 Tax=Alistipes provencensis TaxID=1816676 RepID=UPI000AF8EB67|nr:hypothetical protein [Alistipes provencensis]
MIETRSTISLSAAREQYIAPSAEISTIRIEAGFAASKEQVDAWGNGIDDADETDWGTF